MCEKTLTWRATDDAAPDVRAEIALVADPHERFWMDVRVTHETVGRPTQAKKTKRKKTFFLSASTDLGDSDDGGFYF
jgi:hypothetical protein